MKQPTETSHRRMQVHCWRLQFVAFKGLQHQSTAPESSRSSAGTRAVQIRKADHRNAKISYHFELFLLNLKGDEM